MPLCPQRGRGLAAAEATIVRRTHARFRSNGKSKERREPNIRYGCLIRFDVMGDAHVERWRQRGRVFLWRYRGRPRNYPGWHFTADPQGNASFRELLDLMIASPYSSERVLSVTPPTKQVLSVPNYWGPGPQTSLGWSIKTAKGDASKDEWRMEFVERKVRHTLGRVALADMIKGLEDISLGRGDYALPRNAKIQDDQCLWFWWWLGGA